MPGQVAAIQWCPGMTISGFAVIDYKPIAKRMHHVIPPHYKTVFTLIGKLIVYVNEWVKVVKWWFCLLDMWRGGRG